MKQFNEFIKESASDYGKIKPESVDSLKSFANYINNNPGDWWKHAEEIIKKNDWKINEDKPLVVCEEKDHGGSVYYNTSFKYYVHKDF